MGPFSRNNASVVWILTIILVIMLFGMFRKAGGPTNEIPYSNFIAAVKERKVKSVSIEGSSITARLFQPGVVGNPSNKTSSEVVNPSKRNAPSLGADPRLGLFDAAIVKTVAPDDSTLVQLLMENGVEISVKAPSDQPWYLVLLVNFLPALLFILMWVFFIKQMQVGAGKGMSFGKSKAKLLTESQQKVTFDDVAGIDEARSELEEIIEFLKDPKKFTRLGGRIPKGVLLIGSPGTGKTLLAKAIAGEAGVPFFSISGSDFVEMFVGVGASRVRDLFVQGKKNAPCIIFIDEIDAVGRHRGAGMGGGHDEREQTLNQLLVEMDGFEGNDGVILIAATNRPDVLDPALLRPGRFDRRVIVPRPDLNGRLGILKVHTKRVPVATGVDLSLIARATPGFSGADLEILVNEAALNAARTSKEEVGKEDFEFAKDKVMMGAERRSLLLTDKDKEITAFHESGHALVAKFLKNTDPVHKLTIVPRGMALGLMQQLPEHDKHTYSRSYFLDTLAVLYGGRVAEELVFNELNTGASSDIKRATEIARSMVAEWGMSDLVGPIHYLDKEEHVFLGKEFGTAKHHSGTQQAVIDKEVKRLIDEAYGTARKILSDNSHLLHKVARRLLEVETIDGEELERLIKGDGDNAPVAP